MFAVIATHVGGRVNDTVLLTPAHSLMDCLHDYREQIELFGALVGP